MSDSFKRCIVPATVVQSVTVGPRYGTGGFFVFFPQVKCFGQAALCVRLLEADLRFLQQETIEVESGHVFKLAAFALQVRKSLSQAL